VNGNQLVMDLERDEDMVKRLTSSVMVFEALEEWYDGH